MSRLSKLRRSSHPCLSAELLEDIGERQTAIGLPAGTEILRGPLSRRERVGLHVGAFLIGSWNLVIIDLGGSGSLWFWPWVLGWAGLLALHFAAELCLSRFATRSRFSMRLKLARLSMLGGRSPKTSV